MSAGAIFAHQGGWDEILFVLPPLLIFAALLMAARRRVDRLDDGEGLDRSVDEPRTSDQA